MDTTTGNGDARQIVVATRGLKKTYFGRVPTPVLHGIDIEIAAGEFVAIIGQSGSGKSTLLNILGALDVPTEGQVLIDGVDISTLSEDGLAALRNRVVGFVFQFHYLLDELSCLENTLTPITIHKGEANEEETARVVGLLERVGLGAQVDKRPDTMSGGQNQRCAIIRALANAPKIVLADEPTGNLDSRSGDEVFRIMREMNHENHVAFIMVTHDDRLAQEADRILMIEDGWVHEVNKAEHRSRLMRSMQDT
ncbi:ABC transporter ATP-binding protein [Terriglobus sp. RCC_193]|uniref:ABC transporter ATP-binding protein n=1 Tax=Terriglobus sp. RCC_193 TaxID=3239218 RepID=UPI003525F354